MNELTGMVPFSYFARKNFLAQSRIDPRPLTFFYRRTMCGELSETAPTPYRQQRLSKCAFTFCKSDSFAPATHAVAPVGARSSVILWFPENLKDAKAMHNQDVSKEPATFLDQSLGDAREAAPLAGGGGAGGQTPPVSGANDVLEYRLAATTTVTRRIQTARRIANLDDVVDHLKTTYSTTGLVAAFFRQKKTETTQQGDTPGPYLYFNTVSFVLDDGALELFSRPDQAVARIPELQASPELATYEFDNLLLVASHRFHQREIAKIRDLMLSYYLASDVDGNQVEGAARRLVRKAARTPNCLADIANAISEGFRISAGYYIVSQREPFVSKPDPRDFDLLPRSADPFIADLLSSAHLDRETRKSLRAGLPFSGRLPYEGRLFYYKIVPVILSELKPQNDSSFTQPQVIVTKERAKIDRIRSAAVVLIDTVQIETLSAAFAKELVDDFVGAASHAEKIATLHRFAEHRARQQLQLLASPFEGATDQRRRIEGFAGSVCSALIQVTAAHSASVRFFNPFTEELEPWGSAFCANLPEVSASSQPISADPVSSLNAFVYRRLKIGEYVYVKDVRQPLPTYWTAKGLRTILICRPESQSELCIPIFKTGICIGVLNVEAGAEYGLDRDLKFIDGVARQLGDFVDMVTRSSDAGWLPRMSFMHFTAHEQQKAKAASRIDPSDDPLTARAAQRRMSADFIDPNDLAEVDTTDFLLNIQEFTEAMLGDLDLSWTDVLKISGVMPERLSARHAHSLDVILENILENAKHHDQMRHPISLQFELEDGQVPRLTIAYIAPDQMMFSDATDRVGIAPRRDEVNETYHLGTFLAGVHTRLLGGVMWVRQPRAKPTAAVPFQYMIQIPLAAPARTQQLEVGL